MWRAVEQETIARQYALSLLIGGPVLPSESEIAETAAVLGSYGLRDDQDNASDDARRGIGGNRQ